ncbi:MAG TPA: hypothetical protein VJT49_30040 [Amycolatopsis sp.]|uniref:hypothetical protein n=1 Tax=Amycolatopsis sp. TaxID=37632 RepID=UPI002B47A16A|nr:hypothetical protein [Amycolatopsis sp.]HKS49274.1 hypothetical protein [Amycolatopsis sp.]
MPGMWWDGESMNEWVYSQADRCTTCDMRAVIPNQETAERFVTRSEGRLTALPCPQGNGWHLVYAKVELATR